MTRQASEDHSFTACRGGAARCDRGAGGRRTRRASQSRIIPTNSKRSGVSFADSQSLTASSPIW